jgi:protein-disulfide isomerase
LPPPKHDLLTHTLSDLDYVCPFSAKLFTTIYGGMARDGDSGVIGTIFDKESPCYGNVVFIFRQQIQPWHPSSTLAHEAGLAILRMTDSNSHEFWRFSAILFMRQKDFFDVKVVNETRNATYRRLAEVGAESIGVDPEKMYALLKVPDEAGKDGELNIGNQVSGDVRLMTKMARLTGVHVTPTVLLDGVEVKEISSSWTKEQWLEWLEKNCGNP